MRQPKRAVRLVLLGVAVVFLIAGCQSTGEAKPDPSSLCRGADQQRYPGFYPDLERMVPASAGGNSLSDLISGRYCSERTLGSLLKAGVLELRFAGATWWLSGDQSKGVAMSVYQAPGLTLDALADSFAVGAGQSRTVSGVKAQKTTLGGHAGIRVDVVAGGNPETVFIWPAAAPETFNGVLAIGASEEQIATAVEAFKPTA